MFFIVLKGNCRFVLVLCELKEATVGFTNPRNYILIIGMETSAVILRWRTSNKMQFSYKKT